MKKIKIGIVGCGAAGTSFFSHFITDCIEKNISQLVSIYIFEKSSDIARGLPYNFDYDCNLLNRASDKMSVKHNKQDDFYLWIQDNKERIKNLYPNYDLLDTNCYLPRSIFGLYLNDTFLQIMSHAKQNNIVVNVVRDEVIDVKLQKNQYNICTIKNNFENMDYVILTVGHIPCGKFKQFNQYENFYNSPYPTTQLVSTINKNATVGILGSRLSAIDAAISLTEHGHQGKIYFLSRSKFLPSIKSTNSTRCIKVIDETVIKNMHDDYPITLKNIMKIISDLASYYNGEKSYFYKWLKRPIDPIKFLRHELNEYEQKIRQTWDALFLDGNNIIEFIWNKLSTKDKKWFLHNYRSKWLSYRVGIPRKNAEKILNLLEKNQLSIIRTKSIPSYQDESGKFLIKCLENNTAIHIDYLVNATGAPLKVEDMESSLISNVLLSGLVMAHEFGGIEVDFSTSAVINNHGKVVDNLYAIGSITSGVYFFTSVLALNIKHAFQISQKVVENILEVKNEFQLIGT
ncbi:MAG: hypothetical protein ACD_45C00578G0005 [uncultured bacterium]|nr:MAG: hypothetical protein ACD_45C00578G0005 [uncultured bacterium]